MAAVLLADATQAYGVTNIHNKFIPPKENCDRVPAFFSSHT